MRTPIVIVLLMSSVAVADRKASEPASCIDEGTFEGWCWRRRTCTPKDKAVSCQPAWKQCAAAAKASKAKCSRADEFACFSYLFKVEGPTLKRYFPRKEWGKMHRGQACYRDFGRCSVEEAEREDSGSKIESSCETYIYAPPTDPGSNSAP